jgi:cytochrome c-type biogenesis protein CcmH
MMLEAWFYKLGAFFLYGIPTLTLPFSRGGNPVEPGATVFPPLEKGRVRVGIHGEASEGGVYEKNNRILRFRLTAALITLILLLTASTALAYDVPLNDPAQEARAHDVFRQLRCMVCQNQSINDSDAPLAKDMRTIVREQISTGKTNSEILGFLESRYGEFVLMQPRFAPHTWLLWATPVLALLAGFWGMMRLLRSPRDASESAPLEPHEQAEIDMQLAQLGAVEKDSEQSPR